MRFVAGIAACLLLAACSGADETAAPQAIPVKTVTVTSGAIPNIVELPGRVEAVRTAEVRARVNGIVMRRLYEEGTDVRAGQPLFSIDPRELRASYAQTKASLESARATAANARAVVERYRPLVAENAISKQEYDAAVAAARAADANVSQIRAQLDAASLQLGYTTVRAPISGRAGRAEVTEGALVSSAEATLMTRIEQVSPVYVSFSQSASKMMEIRRRIAAGEIALAENGAVPVTLTFSDGTEYPIKGLIDFLAASVDEQTGTVEIRAEFANPGGTLLPGEFVRARIEAGTISKGIAVPQRAVTIGQTSSTVYVVTGEGKAAVRTVTLGEMFDGKWIINSGLKSGDTVIVSNIQKIAPGAAVTIANTPTGQSPKAAPSTAATAKAD